MPDLALCVLGPLQISCDGAPVAGLESNKVRGLLIYLAVEADRPHARAALAGLLWPDQPPAAAQHNLRQALANLRRALGDRTADPPFLLINRETVQLNPASTYRLDVATFTELLAACETHPHRRAATCASCVERRASAAAVYRGDFLAHFFLSDSAAFEEWASLKRERLRQQALGSLALLAAYHEQHGAYAAAGRAAWRQVELDPWNEEAHRQLMRVLWLSGQRHAALAHYVRCCDTLRRELGVEPAPETTTLYAHIRDTEPDTAAHSQDAGRMPAAATPFIGRESELAHLADLLQHPVCRLITLTGPGGIGKTRLALQAASEATMIFAHGVCFVSLAQLTSADLLVPAIATSLNLVLDGRSDLKERLFSYLRDKQVLLVLDNFEHLLGESSTPIELLSELLQRAAGVSVLVTSRERLRLRGEWVVDVAGLSYPQTMQAEEPGAYSAVELFLQRARQVHGSFAPTVEDMRWIARICRLVAGMPLGIELAAGWVRTLSCQEIAHEIERSLDFLSGSLRDLPARHRSLRAVLDHSWKVLAPDERAALRRLSVFRGGCTREAVEQVAGASVRLLETLVDRSLLHRTSTGRYDLHELVRRYADERLQEEGPEEALRQHAAYFLGLVERAEPSLWGGPDQRAWIERLEGEHDNVRAALQWALDHGEAGFASRLAGAVWRFWLMRGHPGEGRRWLEVGLASRHPMPTFVRAKALSGLAQLIFYQGDFTQAKSLFEDSVAHFRRLGPSRDFAYALGALGWTAVFQAGFEQAAASLEESMVMARELGCTHGIAQSLGGLGVLAWNRDNDYAGARALFEESLRLHQEVRDTWATSIVLGNLGTLVLECGDYRRATALAEETLALAQETRDTLGIAASLIRLGSVALAEGNYRRAGALFEESVALFREQGSTAGSARAFFMRGQVAYTRGDYVTARELLEQCLRLQQNLDDKVPVANSFFWLGRTSLAQGNLVQAAAFLDESREIWSGSADKWHMAWILGSLGHVSLAMNDHETAAARLTESVALGREVGEPASTALALAGLGHVARTEGDHAKATACWEESLALWRSSGYRIDMGWSLLDLGEAARKHGDERGIAAWLVGLAGMQDADRAARLLGAAHALRAAIAAPLEPGEETRHENVIASARAQLGEAAWHAAWAEGQAMTLEQAIAYALETDEPATDRPTTR